MRAIIKTRKIRVAALEQQSSITQRPVRVVVRDAHAGIDDRERAEAEIAHGRVHSSGVREPAWVKREDPIAIHVMDVEVHCVGRQVERPEAPRPRTAAVRSRILRAAIIAASAQLQGGEPDQGQDHGDDTEPDHDGRGRVARLRARRDAQAHRVARAGGRLMSAATFTFKAVDAAGTPEKGEISGVSREAVAAELDREA